MAHAMRCARNRHGCGRRFTLKKPPHKYVKPPRCPYCRSEHLEDTNDDERRNNERRKRAGKTCYCSGYPFPHHTGSMRFCIEHPDYGQEPTFEQVQEYEHTISTPRG